MQRIDLYIHQKAEWPQFKWEVEEIVYLLGGFRISDEIMNLALEQSNQ